MIDVIGEEILWHGMPIADIHHKWHSATEMDNFRRTIDKKIIVDVEEYDDVCGERDYFEREANASAEETDEALEKVHGLTNSLQDLIGLILDPSTTRPGLKAVAEQLEKELG